MFEVVPNIGAVITLGLGAVALMLPLKIAALVDISPIGSTGLSEIRATYGGFFAAMGAWCLITQSKVVFLSAGLCWIGASIGRILSVFWDRRLNLKNIAGIVLEISVGTMLCLSYFNVDSPPF